ncbi:hypothetical protein HMPREF9413_2753 [Paenibacillus sp. HGF7]|nr:hypothetical protein HMPREF9413_2753 [Paenibacillus sp. HGF7]
MAWKLEEKKGNAVEVPDNSIAEAQESCKIKVYIFLKFLK